jgi:uncharacterized peroxidase-related enzyme
MSRILAVEVGSAEGPLRAILDKVLAERGYVGGTRRLLMVDPRIGQPAVQLYEYLHLREDSPLTRLQREMMATVVYGMIGARPCLSVHCEAMRRLTGDEELGPEFVQRWPDYPVDDKTRALLRYARKLTASPAEISDRDIAALKEAGWDDPAIYEATALVGVFNFNGCLEAASGLPMDEIPASARLPEAVADGRPGGLVGART